MPKQLYAHALILLATFLVAGSFIVSQKLSGIIDPISITLLRFVIAALILAPIVVMNRAFRTRIIPSFNRAMIISFFYALFFIGLFTSLEYTTALNTGTIFTLVPLLTALFSIIVFKQTISLRQYGIYCLGIIGTVIVVFKGSLQLMLTLELNYGDMLFMASISCMALYSICSKYFYKEDDALIVLVFMTLIGGCLWMGMALFILDVPLQWEKIQTKEFMYVAYLSLAATLFTSYLYQQGNVILGPKKVMSYIYLNPAAIAFLLFILEFKQINILMGVGILISSLATLILLKQKDSNIKKKQ